MVSPPEYGEHVSGCRTCCGLWLSNDASVGVARGTLHPEVVALATRVDAHQAELVVAQADYRQAAAPSVRLCPCCRATLAKSYVSRQRIELDVCAEHGTWFERYELRRVLLAMTLDQEAVTAAVAAQRHVDQLESDRVRHLMTVPTSTKGLLTRDLIDFFLNER